jgi:hypothetical protein
MLLLKYGSYLPLCHFIAALLPLFRFIQSGNVNGVA